MPAPIYICHKMARLPDVPKVVIDTTSSSGIGAGLSPFLIGPCNLYDGKVSKNMENAWQYSKLYAKHATKNNLPTKEYWDWALDGWDNPRAVRYPMGKGAKPICSIWANEKRGYLIYLKYIDARKTIYGPLYLNAVRKTDAYKEVKRLAAKSKDPIYLRDWDGYNHDAMDMALDQVLENPNRKMGHAFFLKADLTNDEMLNLLGWQYHEPN